MTRPAWIPCVLLPAALSASPQGSFGPYERSVAMVREELDRNPGNAELSLVLAQVHIKAARFSDALEVYRAGAKLYPNDLRFTTGLGKTYLAQGELAIAIETLRRALALIPGGSPTREVRLPLAEAYTRARDFASATEQLRAAAAEGAPSADISFRLGQALDTESRRLRSEGDEAGSRKLATEARRSFETAIRLRPGVPDAHYALGRLLARLGEKELAKKNLEDFRRLKRTTRGVDEKKLDVAGRSLEAGTAVDLATVLSAMGEADRAISRVGQALEVLPRFEPALVARGSIYLRAKRPQDATWAFEELLSAYPNHPAALLGLAQIHILRKDYQQASRLLLRATRGTGAAQAWETLYRLAADGVALTERVEEFAKKALRARPSAENYTRLALTLFEAGKRAECERVLRTGLARYPGHEDLKIGLQILESSRKGQP